MRCSLPPPGRVPPTGRPPRERVWCTRGARQSKADTNRDVPRAMRYRAPAPGRSSRRSVLRRIHARNIDASPPAARRIARPRGRTARATTLAEPAAHAALCASAYRLQITVRPCPWTGSALASRNRLTPSRIARVPISAERSVQGSDNAKNPANAAFRSSDGTGTCQNEKGANAAIIKTIHDCSLGRPPGIAAELFVARPWRGRKLARSRRRERLRPDRAIQAALRASVSGLSSTFTQPDSRRSNAL